MWKRFLITKLANRRGCCDALRSRFIGSRPFLREKKKNRAMTQTTDTLLLVRPFRFRKNEETAINNYFQEDLSVSDQATRAQMEFDNFVKVLHAHKINTLVMQDE